MKKDFLLSALCLAGLFATPAKAQTWDFSQGFSQETLDLLAYDYSNAGNWSWTSGSGRYTLNSYMDSLCAINESWEMQPLNEFRGLYFQNSNNVIIDYGASTPRFRIPNTSTVLSIANVEPGSIITFDLQSANATSPRGIRCISGNARRVAVELDSAMLADTLFNYSLDSLTIDRQFCGFEVPDDLSEPAYVSFSAMNGGINLYTIKVEDLNSLEAALDKLEKVRGTMTQLIAQFEEYQLNGMKGAYDEEYALTNSADVSTLEAAKLEIDRLKDLIKQASHSLDLYGQLATLFDECAEKLAVVPDPDLSEAIEYAKAMAALVVDDYAFGDIFEEFYMSYALYEVKNLPEDMTFSTSQFNYYCTVGNFDFGLDMTNHLATVRYYNGSDSVVSVPEYLFVGDDRYIVVGIGYTDDWGSYGFYGNNSLQEVNLPKTLKFIGYDGFYNNRNLKHIELPSLLTKIAYRAFYYCSSLTDIVLPSGLTQIENCTFYNCSALSTVVLPDSLISIGSEAFRECPISSIDFPMGLQTIDNYAFYGCSALSSLALPEGLLTIGSYAFGNTSFVEIFSKAVNPPSCSSSFSNAKLVYVPEGSGDTYRSANVWKNLVVVDGEGTSLTIHVSTPGTLGTEILSHVSYLRDVNHLTLTGSLNDEDFNVIKTSMTSLMTLDISGLTITSLPNSFCQDKSVLHKVILPKTLTSISDYAFSGCSYLKEIQLPDSIVTIGATAFRDCPIENVTLPTTLQTIGDHAFYYTALKDIVVPEGVTSIGSSAFASCYALQSAVLPTTLSVINDRLFEYCQQLQYVSLSEGLTSINQNAFEETSIDSLSFPSTLSTIGSSAFANCPLLRSVSFNEGLTSIGEQAFSDCDAIEKVVLPSTLLQCYRSFNGCDGLKIIESYALMPPIVNGYNPIYGIAMTMDHVLYVPELTLTDYKLTAGWNTFLNILPIQDYEPSTLNILGDLTLPNSMRPKNRPNIFMNRYLNSNNDYYWNGYRYVAIPGTMTVLGQDTLSIGTFTALYDYMQEAGTSSYPGCNALINESAYLRSDSISIRMIVPTGYWVFFSMPFDVKVSEIQYWVNDNYNTNFVIRKYSGEARAQGDFANTWQNMTIDSTLHAGEGYILQCIYGSNPYSMFFFHAVNNANKNNLFANTDRNVALNENLAEFSQNRSWNLVGNPYPSYFDTRYMDFTAPITVWNISNRTYNAYSPIDDGYVLRPGEAFFVQRPIESSAIKFSTLGRLKNRTVSQSYGKPALRTAVDVSARQVFNLRIANGEVSDQTRFVLNEEASMSYEMSRDASKFLSDNTTAPQFYTLNGSVQYAINERPLAEGIVALGAIFAADGTYEMSLQTMADAEVILFDNLTGKQTDLTKTSYSFTAKAGTDNERFQIKVRPIATGILSVEDLQQTVITSEGGTIKIGLPSEKAISVYSVDGKLLDRKQAASATFEGLQSGVYVVKVQNMTFKVVVNQ